MPVSVTRESEYEEIVRKYKIGSIIDGSDTHSVSMAVDEILTDAGIVRGSCLTLQSNR